MGEALMGREVMWGMGWVVGDGRTGPGTQKAPTLSGVARGASRNDAEMVSETLLSHQIQMGRSDHFGVHFETRSMQNCSTLVGHF